MIVLTTSTSPQIVYFVPREGSGNSDKIFLTDEQTNVTTTINISAYATGDYYHTATATFGLKEGHTYVCKIGKTNDIRFLWACILHKQSKLEFHSNGNNQRIYNL